MRKRGEKKRGEKGGRRGEKGEREGGEIEKYTVKLTCRTLEMETHSYMYMGHLLPSK